MFLGLFEQRKPRQVVDTSYATVHLEGFLVSFLISLWVFFAIVFCSLSGRFGVSYWVHFGRQNRPKSGQVGPKTSLEQIFFEIWTYQVLAGYVYSLLCFSKCRGSRSLLRKVYVGGFWASFFVPFFAIVFGAVLVAERGLLGAPNGPKIVPRCAKLGPRRLLDTLSCEK